MNEAITRLYAGHVERARASARVAEDLFVHFGLFPSPPDRPIDEASFRAAQIALNDALLSRADLRDGLTIVDAGSGLGGTLGVIDRRHERMKLHGVNIDPAQIEVAKHVLGPLARNELHFHACDALTLPFEDGAIDRVLAVEALPHFGSRARFAAEVARVLRPGGLLVASDFVAAPSLRATRDQGTLPTGFLVAASEGLAPWDDFWGEGETPSIVEAGLRAGLELREQVDVTRPMLPTFDFIVHDDDAHALAAEERDIRERGVAALAWALRHGHIVAGLWTLARPA